MTVFAGQGDAARSLPLLWRAPQASGSRSAPGPKAGLTLDAIVAAAVAVADAGTIGALSMRAVAERLGVTAMALYTYVPGKKELLDLMYDGVHAELPTRYPLEQGWRAAVSAWAGDLVAFHVRHPWTLQVSPARPVLGPHQQGVVETLAGLLHTTGRPPATLRRVVTVLIHLVRGTAQTIAESRLATATSGTSEHEWWAARSAMLAQAAPDFAERFPMTVWLGSGGGGSAPDDQRPYLEREADAAFRAGLALLLDGVDAQQP